VRSSIRAILSLGMNQPLRSRLKVAASAFASNAVNGNLRRAQLSYFAAWTAEWAFTVALGIVAYRDGGATAVGLVGLLRMVPSAVVAPLATPLADRGRRERVLVLVASIRGVTIGVAGIVVALDEPVLIVYVLAALATIAGTLYRPAHSALLPSLCRTGQELTSANAVRGMLDSVATLAGPLLAAVLVEFAGVAVVFVVAAGASLAAAALLLRLRYDAPPRPPAPRGLHLLSDVAEGVRTIVRNRDLTLLIGLDFAQTFTRGALTVFTVVVALDLLRIGEPGVGTLTAAVGAGAVIGSLAASLLVGSRRLARWFGVGIALWGLPIALIPLFPQLARSLESLGSRCSTDSARVDRRTIKIGQESKRAIRGRHLLPGSRHRLGGWRRREVHSIVGRTGHTVSPTLATGPRCSAAACITPPPTAALPVKKMWSNRFSSSAVVWRAPPSTTAPACASRYCGMSRASTDAQVGASSDGFARGADWWPRGQGFVLLRSVNAEPLID
jgi:MFS family permease